MRCILCELQLEGQSNSRDRIIKQQAAELERLKVCVHLDLCINMYHTRRTIVQQKPEIQAFETGSNAQITQQSIVVTCTSQLFYSCQPVYEEGMDRESQL